MSLIQLPPEIFYHIAQDIDLVAFGAIFLSCKEAATKYRTDLRLQTIVCNNTDRKLNHNRLKMPIKTLFLEKLTLIALQLNDVDIMKFALPNLNYRSILQKIRPMRKGFVVVPAKRQRFLEEVFKYDAHIVLEYLIEICLKELDGTNVADNMKHIIGILSLLGECSFYLDPSIASTDSKSFRYVMSLFKRFEEQVLISLIFVASQQNTYWGISDLPSLEFFRSLLKNQKKFPEYAFDLNRSTPVVKFCGKIKVELNNNQPEPCTEEQENDHNNTNQRDKNSEDELRGQEKSIYLQDPYLAPVTPLEFAVYCAGTEVIDLLVEFGAVVSKNLPYLAIAFHRWKTGKEDLIYQLMRLGADFNVPLPLYRDSKQQNILRYFVEEPTLDNIIMIEVLMSRGVKLEPTKHEAMMLQDLSFAHFKPSLSLLVLRAQMTGYKTLQPTELTFPANVSALQFMTCRSSFRIRLLKDGTFEINAGENIGTWRQFEGKLICAANQSSIWVRAGSYGYNRIVDVEEKILTFVIFRLFCGELAITEDKGSEMSKLEKMLWIEGLRQRVLL